MSGELSANVPEACALCRALLSEWIDGDLPPRIARAVATHVSTCRPCRLLVVVLRAAMADVARLAEVPTNEDRASKDRPRLHPFGGDRASN